MTGEPTAAETLVACLTPPGSAALAVLAVRGPRAWAVTRELFRPFAAGGRGLPEEATVGPIWLGRLGDGVGDEVVVTATRAGPVPWVEVHCHGGREVVRLLLETFATRNVRCCDWVELERTTAGDPWQAAAVEALSRAPTLRTAAILLDQVHGAWQRALDEVQIARHQRDCEAAARLLAALEQHAGLGRHLTSPWRVVVAGAPNVGKSSLVNALAGYQRCIVSPTPGTTRDVVTTTIAVDGWPVELADTAGLRSDAGDLEGQGIELARSVAAEADLVLWVLDAANEPVWPEPGARVRLVLNKIDLPAAWDVQRAGDAIRVSAHTGAGVAELCTALAGWLVPVAPASGAAVPFTPALCDWVREAHRHCAAGRLDEVSEPRP